VNPEGLQAKGVSHGVSAKGMLLIATVLNLYDRGVL